MDSSGSLNAHALLHLTERVRARTVFQVRFLYPSLLLYSLTLHAQSQSLKEFYGKQLILLNAYCAVDPAVPVCNLAVWNWVQRKWLHCCCDCSQPRYPQGVRWDVEKCAFIYWLLKVKRSIKHHCLIISDIVKTEDEYNIPFAIKKKSVFFVVINFFFTSVYLLHLCWAVILVAHFLQSVSSGLVLGGELVYHRGRAEEGGILTLAGQYSSKRLWIFNTFAGLSFFYFILSIILSRGPNWVATLNAGKGGAHASYYHRANKQVVRIVTYN